VPQRSKVLVPLVFLIYLGFFRKEFTVTPLSKNVAVGDVFFFLFFSLWFQHVKGTGSFKSSSKQTVFPFCSQDELNHQEETFFW
jgi:hypothetical protein